MNVWGVIVAAGKGERAGLGLNKVFYEINGRSVLSRCLDAFARSEMFDGLVLVISRRDEESYRALCGCEGRCTLVKKVVTGGPTRRDSVYNGLCAVPDEADIVAVHDAARPFVNTEIIRATIEAARVYGSGVISTPVVDTIKQIAPDGTVKTPPRSTLRAVQTPQTFDRRKLLEAHQMARKENFQATDDATLFEHYYGSVHLVTADGAEENQKLTTKADFDALKIRMLPDMRVGHGYDAHRLIDGRKLMLCGVEVPYDLGLAGHSDADVAIHALMDALLGALGEGDIGRHFPDSDPQYRGISSMLLLEKVMDRVRDRGYCVVNADITIVAQRPKLSPFMYKMCGNVARGLSVGVESVNVKATTTEHMGFEGEEKGISAQAVVLMVGMGNC